MSNPMIDFPDFGEVKKKLYISCPMNGRTDEAIRHDMDRMHKMAEIVFDQKLEVIPTNIDNAPETDNMAIWCLGESIKKMSEADYFIGVIGAYGARGCRVEAEVASAYEIPAFFVDAQQFMPEVNERWVNEMAVQSCCTGNARAHMPVCV